jgi:phosphoribosylformimino-5-aminoimidazole carboxamide ribotide isomerase
MIIPCIDLQGGKVVQLIQGDKKALEAAPPLEMLDRFAGFPVIQVIDLDAAMGKGSNIEIVRDLTSRARTRVGGGVRSAARALELVEAGAERVVVGTAAFSGNAINEKLLEEIGGAVGRDKIVLALDSKFGRIVVKGWSEAVDLTAEDVIRRLESYCGGFLCTYVDKEGMLEGTDLEWYQRLRASTSHEITAAGGITTIEDIRELTEMNIHAALGMAIYTGRLNLAELAQLNQLPME